MTYTFKIKLDGSSKPPVWRKVKVNESLTFLELHFVIQGVFNWENVHLFQFSPKGWGSIPRLSEDLGRDDWDEELFNDPNAWPYGERYDAAKIELNRYFDAPKQKMVYSYDFGDDWRHIVELVEVTDETILYPVCLAGKAKAPVEDCGGIWGYYHMMEILSDPKHQEYDEVLDWMGLEEGEKWEVNEFDLEEVRERLREVWKMEKM